jgi:AraC-like DNA-binding protein
MPSGALLSFAEPYQYQERIRPAEVQIIPTARGDFRATLSQVDLHHLTLQRGWQSLPTVVRAALHRSRASIMFHTGGAQPAVRIDGIDLLPDILAQGAPGEEHFLQTSADSTWATLTLTPATYAAARATLMGDDADPAMRTSVIRPSSDAMERLRTLHRRFMRLVSSARHHAIHAEVARGAEQALLAAVVDCLAGDADSAGARPGSRNSTVTMRRLYELLEAREGLPLYLMDVCARLGVSRRTLQKACTEHLGLSPHRFLWLRRMQLARHALIAADPRLATVTQIATDLGFWELGRFSVHYRWLFGESPSATLGKRRGQPANAMPARPLPAANSA